MAEKESIVIETKRLILRPYLFEDIFEVYRVVSRKEIYEMTLMIPHPYPFENVEPWIRFTIKNIEYKLSYELGIFERETGIYAGNIGLTNLSKQNNSGELAYFVDPEKWGHGYATEAVKGILSFGFNELGLERILGRCMTCNLASKRVMEKNGLLLEGIARHEVRKEEKYIDVFRLAILSSEYKNSKSINE